jgi:hypothetical protein
MTDNKRRTPSDAKSPHCLWQGELKRILKCQAILVSDWSISKKSSPLKLPSQMNRNLVESIYMYGRLCIKFPQSRMKGERCLTPIEDIP